MDIGTKGDDNAHSRQTIMLIATIDNELMKGSSSE